MAHAQSSVLGPEVQIYVEARISEFAEIPSERRQQLEGLTKFVRAQSAAGRSVRITFICTHNSQESAVYNERSRQIAREMLYVFSQVVEGS